MSLMPLPDPTESAVRHAAVRAAAERSAHPAVLESIAVYTPAQQHSLDALASGACVVTGQQAGLFGGPLYTVFKAAAAIVNARALSEETGTPVAPVFWLQDEDHDFAEIDHVTLLDRTGGLVRASVPGDPSEEGCAVAHRVLGDTGPALDLLSGALEGLPHADDIVALVQGAYEPTASPAAAFTSLVQRWFAEHGLLVVDPMHPALRDAAAPVHARALRDASGLAEALLDQGRALEAAGLPVPVHVRPDAPLSFVHPEGIEGPRVRVEPGGGGHFRVCGTDGSLSVDVVQRGPHTTSALLRPILQDTWLPTAAYVGGPGECAYLRQLPPLWKAFDLPVPLVVPRARFLLIDGGARRLLEQLGLQPGELDAGRSALLARLGTARGDLPEPDALEAELVGPLRERLGSFAPVASGLDAGLGSSVRKTARHVEGAIGKLLDRYRKALARDDEVMVDRLDRLIARLRPEGAPQERVHTWAPFAARVGLDAFVSRVLESVSPFDGRLREIDL